MNLLIKLSFTISDSGTFSIKSVLLPTKIIGISELTAFVINCSYQKSNSLNDELLTESNTKRAPEDPSKTTTKWGLKHAAHKCAICGKLFYLKDQEKKAELIKRQHELDKEFAELNK